MRLARLASVTFLMAAATLPAWAVDSVTWDSSGNGQLNGNYNFREVMWRNKGDSHRIAIYGSIVFDGSGHYSLTSQVADSAVGGTQAFSTTGAYTISASGMGFLDDPIRLAGGTPLSVVWGLVSHGIFIASSTDDGVNNLLIAAQAPASPQTNASFSGSYQAVAVNLSSGDVAQARDMQFPLNPNGQGSLGSVNLTGFVGTGGIVISQIADGSVYSFANGALTLGFGGSLPLGSQTLIAGNALCYLSADGNFFFGGSANAWDMIVGVRAIPGIVPSNTLNGAYYQAGVDVRPSNGYNTFTTYYGAFSAVSSSGKVIGHQRVLTADPMLANQPYDYTYSDDFTLAPDGTHDDFLGLHYVMGAGGAIQIGFGNMDRLGINVALKAPDFSGPGVYLMPDGIASAASSAPFTVGVSRGGFIALYGTNLASTSQQDANMPFTLGGVQVLINGRPAPIYFVRSDVVLAIVPFATTGSVASIQVINDQGLSAVRTVRIKNGTPGIYTNPAGGAGIAIAQHIRGNVYATVTAQDPALPGETILLYLTGLGDVNPPVADGAPAPSDHLTLAVTTPKVVVDGEQAAPVGFAGLTATIVALYAVTVTIPADIAPGNVFLDIALPDSYTTEAKIPIGTRGLAIAPEGKSLQRSKPAQEPPAAPIPGALRRVLPR